MQRACVALLLVAVCLGAAQAATITATLGASNYKLFTALVKCAGLERPLAAAKAKVTVLAPTDAAILAFLKATGISAADATKNEQLCDTLLAYHIIPAVAKSTAVTTAGVTAPTLLKGSSLKLAKVGGKVIVTDAQGNKATVTTADLTAGESVIHGVDKVLLSRYTFTSVGSAMTFYAKSFSTLAAALRKAGLLSTVTGAGFSGTILAPGNKAFAKVPNAVSLPTATLKNVLLNHVLPVARTVPDGFVVGRSYPTLLTGQTLKYSVMITRTTINGKTRPTGSAMFTSGSGATAKVLGHNVFAGKAVIHAINGVLTPATPKVAERGTPKRMLLQRGGGGGEQESTFDMGIDTQMNEVNDAIQWAATTGTPGAATDATNLGTQSSQAVVFPSTSEEEW